MAKRKRTNNYLQNTTPKQKIPTKNRGWAQVLRKGKQSLLRLECDKS
jgi:hypothetical protein